MLLTAQASPPPTVQDLWEHRSLDSQSTVLNPDSIVTLGCAPWLVIHKRPQVNYSPNLSYDLQWRQVYHTVTLPRGRSEWQFWSLKMTSYNGTVRSKEVYPTTAVAMNRSDWGVGFGYRKNEPVEPFTTFSQGFEINLLPLRWDVPLSNDSPGYKNHPKRSEASAGLKWNFLPLQLNYSAGFTYSGIWNYGVFLSASTARPLPILFRYGFEVGLSILNSPEKMAKSPSANASTGQSQAGSSFQPQK